MFSTSRKAEMPAPEDALPGRDAAMPVSERHVVLNSSLKGPFEDGSESLVLGMGCFWGAERRFWQLPGVISTAVGYAAGYTPNPLYEEVCSGLTGHNEVVQVVFDPQRISLEQILAEFWQSHDPTQGMRQGNDVGTQYRSGLYWTRPEQEPVCRRSLEHYAERLKAAGRPAPTTEIKALDQFYFAEDYHQQYLAKNPNGYCGLGGTGVRYE